MEELLEEAENLVNQGVKELILVAQETTVYGVDLYGKKMLPTLLEKLNAIDGLVWIRVLYCYPEEITDELISVMASCKKICHYIDVPIQHASDAVLKRMGRRTNRQQLEAVIEKLRQAMPDIAIRTTLIAGFPGETEEDHESLMEFVDKMEFDRLGVFTYSEEEGTPAAAMPNQIAEEVKEERRDALMELQQEIAFARGEDMVGKQLWVLIEGKLPDEHAYVGRTYMDAPGVDGNIFVQTPEELMTGDMVKVKVTGALEYDLIGEITK
jgi:ribosomal protein S12 methylthiotransferase